jgi:hypothetical protein
VAALSVLELTLIVLATSLFVLEPTLIVFAVRSSFGRLRWFVQRPF